MCCFYSSLSIILYSFRGGLIKIFYHAYHNNYVYDKKPLLVPYHKQIANTLNTCSCFFLQYHKWQY